MERPPRNIATDRLVSMPLLIYAYLIMGLAESLVCFGAYMWTFHVRGVPYNTIFLTDPDDGVWGTLPENIDVSDAGFTPDQQAEIVRQVCCCAVLLRVCMAWQEEG